MLLRARAGELDHAYCEKVKGALAFMKRHAPDAHWERETEKLAEEVMLLPMFSNDPTPHRSRSDYEATISKLERWAVALLAPRANVDTSRTET